MASDQSNNQQEPEEQPASNANDANGAANTNNSAASPNGNAKRRRGPTQASIELGILICQALADRELSTSQLTAILGVSRGRVHRQCLRLEDENRLLRNQEFRGRLFCVDCHRVVTSDTYQICCDEEHDLRAFFAPIGVWLLIRQGPETPLPKSVH